MSSWQHNRGMRVRKEMCKWHLSESGVRSVSMLQQLEKHERGETRPTQKRGGKKKGRKQELTQTCNRGERKEHQVWPESLGRQKTLVLVERRIETREEQNVYVN